MCCCAASPLVEMKDVACSAKKMKSASKFPMRVIVWADCATTSTEYVNHAVSLQCPQSNGEPAHIHVLVETINLSHNNAAATAR